jgi:DNA mismatch repair protein MutS2
VIDDGIVAGIPYINIIHGKGKGILMKAVIDMVRMDNRITSFRSGKPSEGGTGVTIVLLDSSEKKSV